MMNLSPLSIINRNKQYWSVLILALIVSALELPAKAQSQDVIFPPKIAQSSDAAQNEAIKKKAIQVIDLLASGKYEQVRESFSPQLAQSLSSEEIKEIWEQSLQETGSIKKELDAHVINTITADLVVIDTEFEKTKGQFIVTFNDEQQIVGINFPKTSSVEQISEIFVESLASKNYPKARGYLHPFLKTEVFPQQVQAEWEGLIQQNGQFKKILDTQSSSGSNTNKTDLVIVSIEFEKDTKDLFIIFDEERRIVGVDAPTIN